MKSPGLASLINSKPRFLKYVFVLAESIGKSIGEINDWVYDLDADMWQERLEWYLNEFYQIAKSKTVGTTNRPTRESERIQENTETQGEESKS